jgi:DNA-binding CsgD family transcriptional regulator/sugar lactone lactonase YvrE
VETHRLSRRELEVSRLVADGLTNREIAARLFLSERTVDGHLEHVREKLGVNTRAQVAAWVVREIEAAPVPKQVSTPARPRIRWRPIRRRWLWVVAVGLVAIEAGVVLAVVQPPGATIRTVAGTAPPASLLPLGGFSGDGGRATAALLSLPSDVAVTADGTLYIADYKNGRIRRVHNATIVTVAGGGKEALGNGKIGTSVDIEHASGVAVDPSGQPYFLTNAGGFLEVWRIEADYSVTRVVRVGPSDTEFSQWWPPPVGGIAIGARGTIYIADRSGHRVYSYTVGDAKPTVFAGTGHAGSSGDGSAATGAELYRPGGLAVDTQGDVYIADSVNNRIRKVDTRGVITTVAGSGKYYGDTGDGGPATAARLSFPYGVAVARDGSIYISDTGNNRLRKVTPSGTILALAGSGIAGFLGEGGEARASELAAPEGITLDREGDLYVADTLNLRIRELVGVAK